MRRLTSAEIRRFVSEPCFEEKTVLAQDNAWPKISIVTPSFNQGHFLERTILSVLNQNYPNLEYIVMDGGSKDGSVEIIQKYERCLAGWVSHKDDGQSDAIRKGFSRSTGQILAYLNSDDTYPQGTLVKIAQAFNQYPGCDLVFGNTNFVDANERIVGECRFTSFNFATLIYEGTNLHQPGTFWRREIYDRVGGFNPKYQFCMDFDFFCRVAMLGNLQHIRECLANFRVHENSKSSTIAHVGRMEHEQIANMYRVKSTSAYLKYRRAICQVRRFFCYIGQGDVDYALKGLGKRLWRKVRPIAGF